jgi:hypothetical protein
MRSIILDGSDDRPPTLVMRGTTKWWSANGRKKEGALH